YLTDSLDTARKKAVEEYLKKNPELNNGLKALQEADRYCQHLAKTRISPGNIEALKGIRLPVENLIRKMRWSAWPESLKWVTEAFLVSVAVAMIALVTPWEKFK